MRKRPMLMLAFVFLLGICWGEGSQLLILSALTGLCLYAGGNLMRERRVCRLVLRIGILLLVFAAGAGRIRSKLAQREASLGQMVDGNTVTIQGEISKKQENDENCVYELQDVSAVLSQKVLPCGRARVSLSSDIYPIGTILVLEGKVNTFSEAKNEGNFDQQQYYRSQGINFELRDARVESVHGGADALREALYQLRRKLTEVVFELMGEENAGVLSGMLLGDRSQMDGQIRQDYQKAGIAHLLAISALHISIFAMGAYRLLRRTAGGFLFPAAGAVLFIGLYAIMTGSSVSTGRAVAMFAVMCAGAVAGRSYDMLNALGLWVLLALWENPFLTGYAGFVFSVTAVLGIGVIVRLLETPSCDGPQAADGFGAAGSSKAAGKFQAADGFGAAGGSKTADCFKSAAAKCLGVFVQEIKKRMISGIGIQITTLPLVAFYYFEIPTYAVLLNLLVIPLMSAVLISAALGVGAGMFCVGAGKLLILPADVILTIYHKLCRFTLGLPFSQVVVGQPDARKLFLYYLMLGFLMLLWAGRNKRMEEADGEAAPSQGLRGRRMWIYVGFAGLVCYLCHGKPIGQELDMLDVGQGLGIFCSAGDGNMFFIDGGSSSEGSVGTYRILPFLKAKGISGIDYWFISHGDEDHISGAEEILSAGYPVQHLVLAEAMPRDDAYEHLAELARASGTEIIFMAAGDRLQMEHAEMACLFPGSGEADTVSDRNRLSLTLLLRTETMSCLFPGDLSSAEEEQLMESPLLQQVDVYVAAHHGSRYSSSAAYLRRLNPRFALVSCGLHNSYGHPGAEAVEHMQDAGAEIYYTMTQGRIRIQPDGKGRLEADGFIMENHS